MRVALGPNRGKVGEGVVVRWGVRNQCVGSALYGADQVNPMFERVFG